MKLLRNKRLTNQGSSSLLTGSILAILIGFSPYIFYLYEIFPDTPIWENSLFTYESNHYQSVYIAAWTFTGKIVPLYLFIIWFFTCKHWWYHIILAPIIMFGLQLFLAINDDIKFMDSNELIYLVPVIIIILCIVYLIRIKIFDKIYGIDLSEIEDTKISPFSSHSKKDSQEFHDIKNSDVNIVSEAEEEYYTKL